MRILLTNDDGFFSEGIRSMEKALLKEGHEVFVVAPHSEQSAKSHSMTVTNELSLWKHDDYHFSLEGTPADCVIYCLRTNLFSKKIDAVVSGINRGYNLSSDVIYSGTCAAARQGAMYGIPSIAISTERNKEGLYSMEIPGEYLAPRVEEFAHLLIGAKAFLNLNFPYIWNGEVKKASLGTIEYNDEVAVRDRGNKLILRTVSCSMKAYAEESIYPMDYHLTASGYASATVIKVAADYDEERMETLTL